MRQRRAIGKEELPRHAPLVGADLVELWRGDGWKLQIFKRRQRAFNTSTEIPRVAKWPRLAFAGKIRGLTGLWSAPSHGLDVTVDFQQGLRVSGANFRDYARYCRHASHAQSACTSMRLGRRTGDPGLASRCHGLAFSNILSVWNRSHI